MTYNALERRNVETFYEIPLDKTLGDFERLWGRGEELQGEAVTLKAVDLRQTILYTFNVGKELSFKYRKKLKRAIIGSRVCVHEHELIRVSCHQNQGAEG
jgi:hypothetical protein